MKLIIGDYHDGHLTPGFNEAASAPTEPVLQELRGKFSREYREANMRLTEAQLLKAATPDQDIIQAVHALQQLDITLNSLGKYTTEWHYLHHPGDVTNWIDLAVKGSDESGLLELNTLVQHAQATHEALIAHIESVMQTVMPNTNAIAGSVIGAKLLSHAGSIDRFAKMPATTIQLLGAEQALFRFLRNARNGNNTTRFDRGGRNNRGRGDRGGEYMSNRPPKYGVLFNHPLVQAVHPANRGKMARQLANTIAIAIRVDYNHGGDVTEMLKKKVEVQYRALART